MSFYKKLNRERGFTLVELLVVIAIIGILASIILVNLSGSRSKGNDAVIKAQMNQVRSAAEIYYSSRNPQSYGPAATMPAAATACTVGNGASAMFTDVSSALNSLAGTATNWPTGTTLWCNTSSTAYVVVASLATGGYWCVDSLGAARNKDLLSNTFDGFTTGTYPALASAVAVTCK